MDVELKFDKICRVCLKEGKMMSLFKVNVSKKIMSCTNVQVWQNDGLPDKICTKCCATLHISFQFKKLCEKSDSKLREYVGKLREEKKKLNEHQSQNHEAEKEHTTQLLVMNQNNCVYIQCNPIIDLYPDDKFDSFPQVQNQEVNNVNVTYNMQPQPQTINSFNGNLEQMQLYNGYNVPQEVENNGVPNQVIPNEVHLQGQLLAQNHQVQIMQQSEPVHSISREAEAEKRLKSESDRKCGICFKIYESVTKLNRHARIHSKDLPYKCPFCNKSFGNGGNLKVHVRIHTNERPFICTVCTKGCRQAQDLEKHMRTHTGEKPHKCSQCERAFSTKSNLIAHIRTHTGERPYVCSVCQKAFCQSNELTKHMRTHTGEKSHICDVCSKGFNGAGSLKAHARTHTGEKPYSCTKCPRKFSNSHYFKLHMKKHNEYSEDTAQTNNCYVCTTCNKRFEYKNDLIVHSDTHTGSFVCRSNMKTVNADEFNEHSEILNDNRCKVNDMLPNPDIKHSEQ